MSALTADPTAAPSEPSAQPTITDTVAAFDALSDQLVEAQNSVELALGFWEKFVKIQTSYAKSIEELCTSRAGKLIRIFHSKSCEPNKAMQEAWDASLEDLLAYANKHQELAMALKEKVCAPIFRLTSDELPKQENNAKLGKRMLREVKAAHEKVTWDQKRYAKTARDYRARAATEPAEAAKMKPAVEKEEKLYREALQNVQSLYRQSFSTAVPALMKDIETTELRRVERLRDASREAFHLLQSVGDSFKPTKSLEVLEKIGPNDVNCGLPQYPEPPALELVDTESAPAAVVLPGGADAAAAGATSEAAAGSQSSDDAPRSPTKSAHKQESRGFFSSFFSSIIKDATPAAPASDTPAAAEPPSAVDAAAAGGEQPAEVPPPAEEQQPPVPRPDRDDDEAAQQPEEPKGEQPVPEEETQDEETPAAVEPAVASPPPPNPRELPPADADAGRIEGGVVDPSAETPAVEESTGADDDETY